MSTSTTFLTPSTIARHFWVSDDKFQSETVKAAFDKLTVDCQALVLGQLRHQESTDLKSATTQELFEAFNEKVSGLKSAAERTDTEEYQLQIALQFIKFCNSKK